ncbi:MAG TPA: ketopantoate reductase family protein [Methylosinus sp.]|jgi:2-dehydropantoate 2-reductase|uniref:ketopantoate reductase family protein n=1 Tax=Methylosinus sp. TaxID=427 RepID=UPI002F92C1D7
MRSLVLGAGAVGGYFGGRLVEAGADVTFFVREARARLLAEHGLAIESALGGARLAAKAVFDPRTLAPFDLVILTCKAYDLDEALETIAGAVGPGTGVLPLLNGLAHLDRIASRFPQAHVFGGVARISATLDEGGVIRHFGELNRIDFGARDGGTDARLAELHAAFAQTPVEARLSSEIEQELWDKFVFLATFAGITSLMRASIGTVLETPAGEALILRLLAECESVARAERHAPQTETFAALRVELMRRGSPLKSSMLRDIERGGRTEGEHILGDMLARAHRAGVEAPVLEIAATHVHAYEIARAV